MSPQLACVLSEPPPASGLETPDQQGLVLLGALFGTPEFVQAQLQQTLEWHGTLLNQLPNLYDTQVAWLLLCCCACPRAHAPHFQHARVCSSSRCNRVKVR